MFPSYYYTLKIDRRFAAGLKTLCITISGGQEKYCAYSFVYKSYCFPRSPDNYCPQVLLVNCKEPIARSPLGEFFRATRS
jgi:hypothetical protein